MIGTVVKILYEPSDVVEYDTLSGRSWVEARGLAEHVDNKKDVLIGICPRRRYAISQVHLVRCVWFRFNRLTTTEVENYLNLIGLPVPSLMTIDENDVIVFYRLNQKQNVRNVARLYKKAVKNIGCDKSAIDRMMFVDEVCHHSIDRFDYDTIANAISEAGAYACAKHRNRVRQKLRQSGGELSHSVLLKRMKLDTQQFSTVINSLARDNEIRIIETETFGKTRLSYSLTVGEQHAV